MSARQCPDETGSLEGKIGLLSPWMIVAGPGSRQGGSKWVSGRVLKLGPGKTNSVHVLPLKCSSAGGPTLGFLQLEWGKHKVSF